MTHHAMSRSEVQEVHITSLVVQAVPEAIRHASVLGDMPDADVHRADETGKIVVILETMSLGDVTDQVDAIRRVPDVINVTLVYHQIEDAALLDQPVAFSQSPA